LTPLRASIPVPTSQHAQSLAQALPSVRAHSLARHCFIAAGASVAEDVRLVARVTLLERVTLGPRVLVHSGAVLGSDGFGFAPERGAWIKVPQLGGVKVGADVEIGANTTIDRGAIGDTIIEEGVKLDNQIQIGHNVASARIRCWQPVWAFRAASR